LTLLQRKNSEVIPGGLPERSKGDRVNITQLVIGGTGLTNVGEKLGIVDAGRRSYRLKHDRLPEYLAAVSSHDLYRCDLAGALTDVEVGRA